MQTLKQYRWISLLFAVVLALVGTVLWAAPAQAAGYKINNHYRSVASLLTATECYPSGLAGDFKWLAPGYGTNHYGKGFYIRDGYRAKVYIDGTYRYTATGAVTRCTYSGSYMVLVTY